MDSMSDTSLQAEHVRYLLPPDIFEELFSEITPNQDENQSDSGNITNGKDKAVVQTIVSNHEQSTHELVPSYQGVEKNVENLPIQQKYTWAQIVKGEHRNHATSSMSETSFPPLLSTVRYQKPEGRIRKQPSSKSELWK
ncbi:uncharacterized protein LOC109804986 [Cajanus cajan]|uniref:uncharacterized protein LOC109804986 n=1 Tax=Cajanus cajan TaxID=3821 RepID=UPI00098DB51C|nr:uncharacterized protein LOC109804986 [Cajanus cajan]